MTAYNVPETAIISSIMVCELCVIGFVMLYLGKPRLNKRAQGLIFAALWIILIITLSADMYMFGWLK